ncbi:hypothetical protein D3C83_147030 [compost metagenome]
MAQHEAALEAKLPWKVLGQPRSDRHQDEVALDKIGWESLLLRKLAEIIRVVNQSGRRHD